LADLLERSQVQEVAMRQHHDAQQTIEIYRHQD
jgi:Rrf2 family iron-sulfur cluster assembly transcriptional regulator